MPVGLPLFRGGRRRGCSGERILIPPLPRKILLQDAMPKPPSGTIRFEEAAGGHFVEEMDEAQGEGNGAAELP